MVVGLEDGTAQRIKLTKVLVEIKLSAVLVLSVGVRSYMTSLREG